MATKQKNKQLSDGDMDRAETLQLMRFGEHLYQQQQAQQQRDPAAATNSIQISRLCDYVHHFGFSLEKESADRLQHGGGAGAGVAVGSSSTSGGSHKSGATTVAAAAAVAQEDGSPSSKAEGEAAADAAWYLEPDLVREADERAGSAAVQYAAVAARFDFVGIVRAKQQMEKEFAAFCATAGAADTGADAVTVPAAAADPAFVEQLQQHNAATTARNAALLRDIARYLVEPFLRPSWRQNELQCLHKRARCLYTWLGLSLSFMTEEQYQQLLAAAASTAAKERDDHTKRKPGGGGGGGAAKHAHRTGHGADSSTASGAESTVAAPLVLTLTKVDPLLLVLLETRRATSRDLAQLYQQLLAAVDVESDVVAGRIRGRCPEECKDWWWNCLYMYPSVAAPAAATAAGGGAAAVAAVTAANNINSNESMMGAGGAGGGAGYNGVRKYLVDIAASVCDWDTLFDPAFANAPLRELGDLDTDRGAEKGGKGKKKTAAAAAASAASNNNNNNNYNASEDGSGVGGSGGALLLPPPSLRVSLRTAPIFAPSPSQRPANSNHNNSNNNCLNAIEDFYFYCHPVAFIGTHFPTESQYTLIVLPPTKVQWEVRPRLTHTFYNVKRRQLLQRQLLQQQQTSSSAAPQSSRKTSGGGTGGGGAGGGAAGHHTSHDPHHDGNEMMGLLQLQSHQKACHLTARTMPFHISFININHYYMNYNNINNSNVAATKGQDAGKRVHGAGGGGRGNNDDINTLDSFTELCCVVYKCPLKELPSRLPNTSDSLISTNASPAAAAAAAAATAAAGKNGATAPAPAAATAAAAGSTMPLLRLGPEWIYYQRVEAKNEDTFTILTPEVGFYSVVVGARQVRADPYSALLYSTEPRAHNTSSSSSSSSEDPYAFTPIVYYQLKVNFTPVAAPLVPRQHLSPHLVKLLAPLSCMVTAGQQLVQVMPVCGNIAAVAVVVVRDPSPAYLSVHQNTLSKDGGAAGAAEAAAAAEGGGGGGTAKGRPAPATAKGAAAAAAGGKEAVAAGGEPRELVRFLPFHPDKMLYEGTVELRAGAGLELWVLYAAPDLHGASLQMRLSQKRTAAAAAGQGALPPLAGGAAAADAAPLRPTQGKKKTASVHHGGAGGEAAEADRVDLLRLLELQQAGLLFVPFITHLEVRKFLPRDTREIVQPQPTAASEQRAALRAVMGATQQLFSEVVDISRKPVGSVGAYFDVQDAARR